MSNCTDFNGLVAHLSAYIEKHGASNAAAAMSQVFEDQLEIDEYDRPDDWCEQALIYQQRVSEFFYEAIDVRSDRFDREDVVKKLDILIYDIKKLHDFLSTTKALMS